MAAVRAGRISLATEEAAGGHTILKHVAKTEAELRARLLAERNIPAATSFKSLREAEQITSDAARTNQMQIRQWPSLPATRANEKLILNLAAKKPIGYGVVRATGSLQQLQKFTLIFKRVNQGSRVYFVLTAYPKP